jgi:hypothetical protein
VIPNQYIDPRPSNYVPDNRNENRGNPYYDNFPTDDDCDKAISNNDYPRIRDFISYVSNSKFECKKRA